MRFDERLKQALQSAKQSITEFEWQAISVPAYPSDRQHTLLRRWTEKRLEQQTAGKCLSIH